MGPRRTEKEEETGGRRDMQEMKIHGTEPKERGEGSELLRNVGVVSAAWLSPSIGLRTGENK